MSGDIDGPGGPWVTGSVFNEIAALLVLAAAVGFLGLTLRQPLIVSLIVVGISPILRC